MKIEILSKNLMILASAGSGKTYQLGNRVIGLVGAMGVNPESIVALTFTRKAAGEFADSVLSKLGEAVLDESKAGRLSKDVGQPLDPMEVLEKVVRALPRFNLGTMDGFFARVVRGFQYELGLTGGKFELVQGPKLEAALEEILTDILGNALDGEEAEGFLHAFRRATIGRDERGVARSLGGFFQQWHGLWKSGAALSAYEPEEETAVRVWEERKQGLAVAMMKAAEGIEWTDKRQPAAFAKMVEAIAAHGIGSGSLDRAGGMFDAWVEWASGRAPLELKHYKVFRHGPELEARMAETMKLLAACELAAAVGRTRAVIELVARYDQECERRLRRRGMLGFDDVKVLMGRWMENEEQRLRREAVDFRLDARYQHWLLDEFQDTSPAEWRGMEPLLDEAASDPAGSLFVVGDVKQAIYGWRGGDVRLFERVRQRYGSEMTLASMPDSWRSCEAVLALVNQVCGDMETLRNLFGREVAERWPWEEHVPARAAMTGESRVEIIDGEAEERHDRLVAILREIGVGQRELTCGVLVRTNDQLRTVAEKLRSEGFDVIEEGVRRPGEDHPVGVALVALAGWLADPADDFQRSVLRMSPIEQVLQSQYENDWTRWEGLLAEASAHGIAGMMRAVVEPLWEDLSDFGRRRAADLLGAWSAFDAAGLCGARAALAWVEGLEVSQSPGVAAVQVMTIHKSKGLGFDVVVLPEIEDKQVPNAGKFGITAGDGWVLQNPAAWVRGQFPVLRDAEQEWAAGQCYEAMCVLYVALTRAKRGLYVLLPAVPDSRKESESHASPANWIRQSLGLEGGQRIWQTGDVGWYEEIGERTPMPVSPRPQLAPAKPMRSRSTASSVKAGMVGRSMDSSSGKVFGSEVHEVFEGIGWIDEEPAVLPATAAGKLVGELLEVPEIRGVFCREGRDMKLFREQSVEAIIEGRWWSGVLDRLHVSGDGRRVWIIDFKTDAVADPEELRERYEGQMSAYREVLSRIYPEAEIEALMLSTKWRKWIQV
ncbi:MAG: UvrD-helicase domain-containing protein [Akkermansiaceae bacterium]|jgi:ATP-dependent exoDNAse (exonuclease V) beta subunit|nr:UvrD-helicase domain-containing protein [Akkermansiaceae bacterium]